MKQLIEFESLAAKKELDKESRFYLDTIDTALQNENNKNIAIAGGYGAGKTTIIDSYFESNKSKADKMMRISIATFQSETEFNPSSTMDNNLLEQQILQQMFFQVKPNKIFNSKFTKVSDLSFLYTFGVLLYLLFTTIFTVLIVSNNWLDQYYLPVQGIRDLVTLNWLWILAVCLIIVLNGVSLWLIFTFFRKLGVSKFGVANTTIEFNFKDGSTVFNHYLDEIIYLFRKTNYKYIVFEDLDRFEDINIFERLRGLNTTLNRSAHITDGDIKFIYALRDDVFTGDDEAESIYNRTKFFDFIIPTVKVMHSSTAEAILSRKLDIFISDNQGQEHGNNSNNQRISKLLIEDVALFINDMRTLINICNEFEVFRMRLQNSSITYNNLFAFIVYKNIYPNDYSDLIENKGLVFDVFNKKEMIVESLQNQIDKLKRRSENGIGSIIIDKKDIAVLFAKKRDLYKVKIKQGNIHLISTSYSNSVAYVKDGLRFLDYFLNENTEGEITFYRNESAVRKYSNFEDFFTINTVNYLELYKDFDDKIILTKEEIESRISELLKKIRYVETKSVSRLIKEDGINLHVNLENKKLLYFLIRNNWLNETYEDYLTVFREGSISIKENKFIQSIKLGETTSNLHLQLKNKEKVAEKIRIDDISSISALNVDLIVTLLKNNTEINYDKLSKIIRVLFSEFEVHFEEFLMLIEGLKEVSQTENLVWKFLQFPMQNQIDIWELLNKAPLSKEQKEEYVITFLKYSNINELDLSPKTSGSLREFISYDLDERKLIDSNNMYELLDALNVKFTSLAGINEETIFNSIVEINCYEINLNNLRRILDVKNISIAEVKKDERIYDYCFDSSNNLALFITKVLLEQEKYYEKEDMFIEFTEQLFGGKYEIDKSIKQSIVQHWSGFITDLSRIDSFELIKILVDKMKFDLTWENIMYCHEVFKDNGELLAIDSLLSTENSWSQLITNSHEEVQETFIINKKYQSFVNLFLKLNLESHPKIKEFIPQLSYPVELEDISKIDNKVLEILIDQNVLYWNMDTYNSIHLDQYKVNYLKNKISDAIDEIPELIEGNLIWSIELFTLIYESEEIDMDIKEKYFRDNLLEIEYREFKLIFDSYKLEFNKEIIDILIEQSNKEEFLVLYLIQQWRLGSVNDVSNTINKYHLPWSKDLFVIILDDDVNIAVDYLLSHIDRIEEININQELFDSLIANSDDYNIVITLIHKYQNDIDINDQVSGQLYDTLLAVNEPDILLSKLNKNTVYKILEKLSLESSSEFLYEYLVYKDMNRDEIFEALSNLSEPFKSIKLKAGRIRFQKTHTSIERLLNYLESRDLEVISSFTPSEKGYIVNRKIK